MSRCIKIVLAFLLLCATCVPIFADNEETKLPLIELLIPGYSRIEQGDTEGYWTAPGMVVGLAGTAYMFSQQKGLTLYDSLPYALSMTASAYGAESLIYNANRIFSERAFPNTEAMSFSDTLATPFLYDFSKPYDLLGIGMVAVVSIISIEPSLSDVRAYFSSDTVPLWGVEMNPYLAASCFLGYTAVTNVFVATGEETAVRSILLDRYFLGSGTSEALAVLGSGVIFGAAHLSNILINIGDADYRNQVYRQSISATGMGLVLGALYLADPGPDRRDGLGYSTRLHYLWNVMAMNTGYWVDIGKKKRSDGASSVSSAPRSSGVFLSPCSLNFRFALD
jgi:membrane protease YdiL (CAAX protease family)